MWLEPAWALRITWGILVPILPATFLLSPALWRGVCPLATLNELGNRVRPGPIPSAKGATALTVAGMGLFALLVPARHLVFDSSGAILGVTAAAVGAMALGLGVVFSARSGFCNGLCPILPVEQLYGQSPLLRVPRGRCDQCSACTTTGCLDLAGEKALLLALGPARKSGAFLATPIGAFAAALPGFVAGYHALRDVKDPGVLLAYAAPLSGAAVSLALSVAVVRLFRPPPAAVFVVLSGLAVALHYWFAGPVLARALALPESAATPIRAAALLLVVFWVARALRRPATTTTPAPETASRSA
jgi:hypothetical protein